MKDRAASGVMAAVASGVRLAPGRPNHVYEVGEWIAVAASAPPTSAA
jgi:hypothetical protein